MSFYSLLRFGRRFVTVGSFVVWSIEIFVLGWHFWTKMYFCNFAMYQHDLCMNLTPDESQISTLICHFQNKVSSLIRVYGMMLLPPTFCHFIIHNFIIYRVWNILKCQYTLEITCLKKELWYLSPLLKQNIYEWQPNNSNQKRCMKKLQKYNFCPKVPA